MTIVDTARQAPDLLGPHQAARLFEALPGPSRAALVALHDNPAARTNPACRRLLRNQGLLDLDSTRLTERGRFVVANRPRRCVRPDVYYADIHAGPTVTVELPGPADLLAAALRWLVDTEQPDGALLQHHGVTLPLVVDNRLVRVIPRSAEGHPVIVVDVANRMRDHQDVLLTRLQQGELDWWAGLLADLGVTVYHQWNGWPAATGSLALDVTVHPTLLAAVDGYLAGCPTHPGPGNDAGVFCRCGWWAAGYQRLVQPTVRGATR